MRLEILVYVWVWGKYDILNYQYNIILFLFIQHEFLTYFI